MVETDVEFQFLGTTADVDVIVVLMTSASEYDILVVSTLDALPNVKVIEVAIALIASAEPVISSMVSPFIERDTR